MVVCVGSNRDGLMRMENPSFQHYTLFFFPFLLLAGSFLCVVFSSSADIIIPVSCLLNWKLMGRQVTTKCVWFGFLFVNGTHLLNRQAFEALWIASYEIFQEKPPGRWVNCLLFRWKFDWMWHYVYILGDLGWMRWRSKRFGNLYYMGLSHNGTVIERKECLLLFDSSSRLYEYVDIVKYIPLIKYCYCVFAFGRIQGIRIRIFW